jgi:hypothetical protein
MPVCLAAVRAGSFRPIHSPGGTLVQGKGPQPPQTDGISDEQRLPMQLPVLHSPTSPLQAAPEGRAFAQRWLVRSHTPWHSALSVHAEPSAKRPAQVWVVDGQ